MSAAARILLSVVAIVAARNVRQVLISAGVGLGVMISMQLSPE